MGALRVLRVSSCVLLASGMASAASPETADVAPTARESRVEVRGSIAAAHAVSAPQSRELGTGGAVDVGVAWPVSRIVALEVGVTGMALAKGAAPPAGYQARSVGMAGIAHGGARVHPLGTAAGLWIDANVGVADTGGLVRPALGGRVGYDFRIGGGRLEIGPFVGYTQIVQPEDQLRPEDARIASLGLVIGLGQPGAPALAIAGRRAAAPLAQQRTATSFERGPSDRDGDSIVDDEDACPDVPGLMTYDPRTNGCPAAEEGIRVEGDRLFVTEIIHFDFDSPYIRMSSRAVVESVARFIVNTPDIVEIAIEGHADAMGTTPYNIELSQARADNVRTLMVVSGVDPGRLTVAAFGKSRLKIQTMEPEERNRRVEFFVTKGRTVEPRRRASR